MDGLLRSARSRAAQGRGDGRRFRGFGRGRLDSRPGLRRSRAVARSASPVARTSVAMSSMSSASTPASTTSGNLAQQLKAARPKGIDVNFENVGGDILDTILMQMNVHGRIALCGLISGYNATELPKGQNPPRRADPAPGPCAASSCSIGPTAYQRPSPQLGAWNREGKLKIREDVRTGGLEAFAETLNLLYTGGNNGKLVLSLNSCSRLELVNCTSSATARRIECRAALSGPDGHPAQRQVVAGRPRARPRARPHPRWHGRELRLRRKLLLRTSDTMRTSSFAARYRSGIPLPARIPEGNQLGH